MAKIITKEDLLSWLSQLIKEYLLVAPTNEAEVFPFRPVTGVEQIVFNSHNTTLSPKDVLFSPSETMFFLKTTNSSKELVQPSLEKETILFSLRPCDAKGISILDKLFLAPPTDTLYQEKRNKTALIGIACSRACPECFCTSLGTGPHDPTNLDILLTESAEGYAVLPVTEKGKALLANVQLKETGVTLPSPPSVDLVPAEDIVAICRQSSIFNNSYWDRVADRCIHCNICAYVCPVCYCFDIRDYIGQGKIERVRSWESCQSPGFTRLAGGYNHRGSKGARLRQRFYHKFLYFPERFGDIKCTGCGRCVRACPVNIDIREILSDLQKIGVER